MYAIPAGMYASQVWATPFLQQGKEMDNPIKEWLLTVLKRLMMVRVSTPSWRVMHSVVWSLYGVTGSVRKCDCTILRLKVIAPL